MEKENLLKNADKMQFVSYVLLLFIALAFCCLYMFEKSYVDSFFEIAKNEKCSEVIWANTIIIVISIFSFLIIFYNFFKFQTVYFKKFIKLNEYVNTISQLKAEKEKLNKAIKELKKDKDSLKVKIRTLENQDFKLLLENVQSNIEKLNKISNDVKEFAGKKATLSVEQDPTDETASVGTNEEIDSSETGSGAQKNTDGQSDKTDFTK